MPKRVIVPVANGFEEIEAVVIIDMLRRAGLEVVVAGVEGADVIGSHDIALRCDALFVGPRDLRRCLGRLLGWRLFLRATAEREEDCERNFEAAHASLS